MLLFSVGEDAIDQPGKDVGGHLLGEVKSGALFAYGVVHGGELGGDAGGYVPDTVGDILGLQPDAHTSGTVSGHSVEHLAVT